MFKKISVTLIVVHVLFISAISHAKLPRGVEKITSIEGITEYRLKNGLQVLLFPDVTQETITVNVTYKVGSKHENYGETGMAHLLEHLVFKGTPRHPNIPKELTDHGAEPNGTTWTDRTNYFETFSATDENLNWESPNPVDKNSRIKDELLIPTKIYQRILAPLISNKLISGLSHITGGGITENLPRILPNQLSFEIDLNRWKLPRLMSWIIKKSEMTEEEALRTFNCGIGMICVVPKINFTHFSQYFYDINEPYYIIGKIKKHKSNSYQGSLI